MGARSVDNLVVVVVDDHPLWRETLATLLLTSGVAGEVHQASDGRAAIALTRKVRPDVVLMDMQLPEMTGVEATAEIHSDPGTPVLVLCSSDQEKDVVNAVRAGAAGYILKTAGGQEIITAIRRVKSGELVFPPEVAPVVLDELRGRTRRGEADPLADLTERERDVLALMAQGLSNNAVAERLYLSPKTVESYISTIFGKLGLEEAPDIHRRVQAVVAYLRAASRGDS